jgi:hypothetical protein
MVLTADDRWAIGKVIALHGHLIDAGESECRIEVRLYRRARRPFSSQKPGRQQRCVRGSPRPRDRVALSRRHGTTTATRGGPHVAESPRLRASAQQRCKGLSGPRTQACPGNFTICRIGFGKLARNTCLLEALNILDLAAAGIQPLDELVLRRSRRWSTACVAACLRAFGLAPRESGRALGSSTPNNLSHTTLHEMCTGPVGAG